MLGITLLIVMLALAGGIVLRDMLDRQVDNKSSAVSICLRCNTAVRQYNGSCPMCGGGLSKV